MARDSEKKDHMFAKWVRMKKEDAAVAAGKNMDNRRPFLASECDSIKECEKWRGTIISEISHKMNALENVSIGENRLRELNDEVNKLVRTKGHWDKRIRELGGDPSKYQRHHYEIDGVEVPGARGYKYYGCAKDLPGIKDLFNQNEAERILERNNVRKRRGEGAPRLGAIYWGRTDDSILVPLERKQEEEDVKEAIQHFMEKKARLLAETSSKPSCTSMQVQVAGGAGGLGTGQKAAELAAMQDDSREELLVDAFAIATSLAAAACAVQAQAAAETNKTDTMTNEDVSTTSTSTSAPQSKSKAKNTDTAKTKTGTRGVQGQGDDADIHAMVIEAKKKTLLSRFNL